MKKGTLFCELLGYISVHPCLPPMERPSQQSIQRRGLLHLGFDKLSYKTLSTTTPGGVPTGFHMVNIHLGKELGRYAA